jgi:prepilin-type processing-associated H-X9-DG protein
MRTFTIRRLMLVIAAVAVVLGGWIGLERLSSYREVKCGPTCGSNLKNIVLSLHAYHYHQDHNAFPSGTWLNPSLPPEKRLSWYAATLPYLDATEYWVLLDKSQPWDAESNEYVAGTRMMVLNCPEAPRAPLPALLPTQYIGIAGLGTDAPFLPKGHPRAGIFGYERQTALADITDGAACTMIITESGRARGSWLAGGPATVRGLNTADLPYIGPGRQFGGIHSSGSMVAFADGSVRFVSDSIDPHVFEAFSTIAGGEKLPPNPFD